MRLITITFILLISPSLCMGSEVSADANASAEGGVAQDVERYVRRWESQNPYSIYVQKIMEYDVEDIIREARRFSLDDDKTVRSEAISIEFQSAVASERLDIIRNTVEYLTEIVQGSPNLNDAKVATSLMLKLGSDAFSDKAKRSIIDRISSAKPTSEFVLLVGIAQLSSQKDWLIDLESNGTQPVRRRATLALARMGHQPAINKVMENYREKASDPTSRLLNDAKNLRYIRSNEAVDELIKELNSDIIYPRTVDTDPISHAAVAITHLHQIIEGFPVQKTNYSRITEEEIATCREWVVQQDSLNIVK